MAAVGMGMTAVLTRHTYVEHVHKREEEEVEGRGRGQSLGQALRSRDAMPRRVRYESEEMRRAHARRVPDTAAEGAESAAAW